MKKALITGGCGFIGSYVVEKFLKEGYKIAVVDILDYAASPEHFWERLQKTKRIFSRPPILTEDPTEAGTRRFSHLGYELRRRNLKEFEKSIEAYPVVIVHASIGERNVVRGLLENFKPQKIVNLAALTHVDTSIEKPESFLRINTEETFLFFQEILRYQKAKQRTAIVHVSTDEVYGSSNGQNLFKETSPLLPGNPYSASKASAEMFLISLSNTYSLKVRVARPCNALGPGQNPEKLIPKTITKALKNQHIPLYGDGKHRREWLYAGDTAEAIYRIAELDEKRVPQIEGYPKGYVPFNIGSGNYVENLQLVKKILSILGKGEELINFVEDRPGHDRFYGVDFSFLQKTTGWKPSVDLENALKETINWYRKNIDSVSTD